MGETLFLATGLGIWIHIFLMLCFLHAPQHLSNLAPNHRHFFHSSRQFAGSNKHAVMPIIKSVIISGGVAPTVITATLRIIREVSATAVKALPV